MEIRQEKELTLRDLFATFRKRRKIVYGTVLLMSALCALYCAVATRRYEAKGTVQVQKENTDGMGLDSLMGMGGDASDALEANIIIQTQVNILQSDTLALRTIQDLHMEQTEDFREKWNPIGWVMGLMSPGGVQDKPGASLEDSPDRRRKALKVFSKNLTVKPVSGTRLIEIDYLNPDPKLAAAVVNDLTQGLVEYTFQTRFNATNQASTWLAGQLGELRKQSEELQQKVVNLERQSGVYSLGTVDSQGREQAYSGVLDQLQQATTALSAARQNRILKGAIMQAAQSGDAEQLSGLAGNATSTTNNSLALLQNLRQQEAAERAAYNEAQVKFGSAYPKLAEMRGNLEGLQRSIHDEVNRLSERAKSDYEIASKAEDHTLDQFMSAKRSADKLNDKAIEYAIVRQEADQSRALYEDLLKRLHEAGVLAGLKSSNITVVDPGRIPSKPKKPNVPVYMAGAVGGGAFLGILLMLMIDAIDNRIAGVSSAEEVIGQPILGATPHLELRQLTAGGQPSVVVSKQDPHSTYAESVRSIRTSLLLTGNAREHKVILITSSIAGEGKTTFATNLSLILAQLGCKVLLVDMDLRRGTIRHKLNLPASAGLSAILADQVNEVPLHVLDGVPDLKILLAGAIPPNPSELLNSGIHKVIEEWRQEYDFVVLDGAPLLPVTDSLIAHQIVDITLLLARSGYTERAQLQRSHQMLTENKNHYVGVVLNDLRPQDDSYYGYYGYRRYSYHYGVEGNEKSN